MHRFFNVLLCIAVCATLLSSCKKSAPPAWQQFMDCANNDCVAQVVAVKDLYLQDPTVLFEEFIKTDERGEDHFVGWLYILRDSVLMNPNFASDVDRSEMQAAILDKTRPFENDAKYGSWAKSILGEIGALSIVPEMEMITGTYAYELPNDGGSGEIKIYPSDDGTVRYAIEVVGPAPAHNQGMMEGTAPLKGNVVTITNTEFGGNCVIELTFADDQITAKTLSGDAAACGFGNNVRADGTYTLTDDLNPFAAEGGDDVPAGLEGHWVSTSDAKSEVVIGEGKYVEIYEGKEVSSFPYRYFNTCPDDCSPAGATPCLQMMGQDILCYAVVKVSAKSLELSMIGGTGNTLAFVPKK
jgi:hypothetical protein